MPLHGVRLLKRRFSGASQPENSKKKRRGLSAGRLICSEPIEAVWVAVAIGTAAHLSRRSKPPSFERVMRWRAALREWIRLPG